MMKTNTPHKVFILIVALTLMTQLTCRAQYTDCSTGLLQMPTADMQEDGTFMITNNFLNKHSLASSRWNYNTFQYGIGVSLWGRVEMSYVCTLVNGAWDTRPEEEKWERLRILRNQDRHFTGRICLLREGEFGLAWMPALVVGVSDPVTGSGGGEYIGSDVDGDSEGNGFFNRNFVVLTKHFSTSMGRVGVHAGYQFNSRKDYYINAPCVGINWQPIWLQGGRVMDRFDIIMEYDSRTINLGVIASVWENRFEAMLELQNFQWINFGLRFKLRLK